MNLYAILCTETGRQILHTTARKMAELVLPFEVSP